MSRPVVDEDFFVPDEAARDLFHVVYRWWDQPVTLGFATEATISPLYGTVDDPETVGRDAAAFCIGEPLGSRRDRLVRDANGVHWWGTPLPE